MTRAAFEQILERLCANPVLPSFARMHELGHGQLQHWRQIRGKGAKAVRQTRKRQQSLTTRIRLVQKAGLRITAIKPDGTIITSRKPNEPEDDGWREVLLK